jgi:CRP-like cAMP-binding protein
MPAFYSKAETYADVVKMVKLNMAYSLDGVDFTTEARSIAEVIDRNFQDQKVGVAIINLLRGLPIFDGLGDGELRKIARLFSQKLYRPGERIFQKGDQGEEAYIVMRGQVDIQLEENANPIASVPSGKIFGEMAFLDGAPRTAFAVASQASILLVAKRSEMNMLVQREPHLGMVIMKNVALDLSNKLRQANSAIANLKR